MGWANCDLLYSLPAPTHSLLNSDTHCFAFFVACFSAFVACGHGRDALLRAKHQEKEGVLRR